LLPLPFALSSFLFPSLCSLFSFSVLVLTHPLSPLFSLVQHSPVLFFFSLSRSHTHARSNISTLLHHHTPTHTALALLCPPSLSLARIHPLVLASLQYFFFYNHFRFRHRVSLLHSSSASPSF
ncbi:hypothetical protein EDD21DRAFT_449221, partial [Dissophora ornata]